MTIPPEESIMTHEEDQILTTLGKLTMCYKGLNSPTAIMADILDPIDADPDELTDLNREEREVLLMYAKLGRNVFLRHWEKVNDEEQR